MRMHGKINVVENGLCLQCTGKSSKCAMVQNSAHFFYGVKNGQKIFKYTMS